MALLAVEREMKRRKARDSLIDLAELMMPDPAFYNDSSKTRYAAQAFHRALADALQRVERKEIKRLIVCMPPRHGKTQLASKIFPAWYVGRDPYRQVMVGTYNQPFADDFGKAVREVMQNEEFGKVFKECKLATGSMAVNRLQTERGGIMAFVGRGGSITGRGANLFVIDDPLKNSKEADSQLIRDELWTWFHSDVISRCMDEESQIIVIQTRWHEDDLVGRLTDPNNIHYAAEGAKDWHIINLPAIAEEDDVLGRKAGEALWPTITKADGSVVPKFGVAWLRKYQRGNPRGFMALYQQRPTPLDGDLIKAEHIVTYAKRDELPKRLRVYAFSDHATGEKTINDRTCILIVGVDEHDRLWLTDCWWKRAKTDAQADAVIRMIRQHKPIAWYMENDPVTKSFLPFLKKRMREEKAYVAITAPSAHTADKVGKAASIIGRMSMGMVIFPKYAAWFDAARTECLKFPRASHDDFVDCLSLAGRALTFMHGAAPIVEEKQGPAVGSFAWMKAASKQQSAAAESSRRLRGM